MKGSVWSEQCLWSEALIFDAALTNLLHWSSRGVWEGQGLAAQSVCQRPDSGSHLVQLQKQLFVYRFHSHSAKS